MTRLPWTPSDLDALAAAYPDTPTSDLAKAFGRTERAIYQQARLLGLNAWHKDYKTGKSGAEILEGLGRTVERTPDTSIEDGIRHARMMFPMAFVDRDRCTRLLQCLGRYRRRMHARTSEPMAPEHDKFSHGADAWRYLGLVVDQLPSSMGGAQRIKRRGSGMAV